MAQWLWRLQSDTLGSSPAVAGFSLFSFSPKQVGFQQNFYNVRMYLCMYEHTQCIVFWRDSGPHHNNIATVFKLQGLEVVTS